MAWRHHSLEECAHSGGAKHNLCLLGDRFNKRNWLNTQRVRQFDDVDKADVTFPSLDSANIVSMQVRQLRKAFLGKATLRSQFANAFAE